MPFTVFQLSAAGTAGGGCGAVLLALVVTKSLFPG